MSVNIQQIKFYEIPPSDIDRTGFSIDIVDSIAESTGDSFKDNMRDRNINSKWITTGSEDASNTEITFTLSDSVFADVFIFMACNFKSYLFEYFDGSNMVTIADVTDNDSDYIEIPVGYSTSIFKITIRETIIADAEKFIGCIFIGTLIGQLQGWPVIKPEHDFDIQETTMLSGKKHVVSSVGGFSFSIKTKVTSIQEDFDLLQKVLFSYKRGFFAQLSGGSREQFSLKLIGYDPNYIYKVKPVKNYAPDFYKGIYAIGSSFDAEFAEVI